MTSVYFVVSSFINVKIRKWRNIIFPVVYGYETWCYIMGEQGREAVEDRLLARIIGPNEHEVTGRWKTLHSEDLQNLNLLTNIVRMMKS
jgi:hypothetical protein